MLQWLACLTHLPTRYLPGARSLALKRSAAPALRLRWLPLDKRRRSAGGRSHQPYSSLIRRQTATPNGSILVYIFQAPPYRKIHAYDGGWHVRRHRASSPMKRQIDHTRDDCGFPSQSRMSSRHDILFPLRLRATWKTSFSSPRYPATPLTSSPRLTRPRPSQDLKAPKYVVSPPTLAKRQAYRSNYLRKRPAWQARLAYTQSGCC